MSIQVNKMFAKDVFDRASRLLMREIDQITEEFTRIQAGKTIDYSEQYFDDYEYMFNTNLPELFWLEDDMIPSYLAVVPSKYKREEYKVSDFVSYDIEEVARAEESYFDGNLNKIYGGDSLVDFNTKNICFVDVKQFCSLGAYSDYDVRLCLFNQRQTTNKISEISRQNYITSYMIENFYRYDEHTVYKKYFVKHDKSLEYVEFDFY